MALTTSSTGQNDAASAKSTPGGLPPHLYKAMGRLTEISSLPEITTKIIEVVEDPRATAHTMHEIVKNDPALASKILKVVNSAFYGLPSQIASLDRAIVMLGLSAVKNIALAASLAKLLKPGNLSDQFEARDLWRHCISVGVCGRMLTKAAHGHANDEAFVAGLVHDMGLLVEFQLFPDQLAQVVGKCQDTDLVFCDVETELIGANHQQFGAALSAKWKFPPTLRCVISHHHNPAILKPEFRRIATLVNIADTICCQQQHGFWLTGHLQQITEESLTLVGVTAEQVADLVDELPERIEEAEAVFSDV
jgi:HD-like signal output (HDOD) protein